MSKKAVALGQLEFVVERTNREIRKRDTKIEQILSSGYEANVLNGVMINGVGLAIADKMVNIIIKSGITDGTISVHGVDVAVRGLAALAYKAEVSESDLASALKTVINGKAAQSDVNAISLALDVLNGTGTGSVKKTIDEAIDAFAEKVSNDGTVNTIKELVDWVADHGSDVGEITSGIERNTAAIAALAKLIGILPEGATSTTVVAYIAEAIAALNIGDYAKTSAMNTAIANAIANHYTKSEINEMLSSFVMKDGSKVLSENDYTNADKKKLSEIAAGATKVEPSTNNGKIKINGTETTVYTEPSDVLHGEWATDVEVNAMLTDVFGS